MVEIESCLQEKYFKFTLLGERSKKPLLKNWQNEGFTWDSEKIKNWNGNIGIVLGIKVGQYRLICIDIDGKNQLQEEIRRMPKTLVHKTPGGGFHIFYWTSFEFQSRKFTNGKHLGELRVEGSQVVIPPSIHPNGKRYEVFLNEDINYLTSKDDVFLNSLITKFSNYQIKEVDVEFSKIYENISLELPEKIEKMRPCMKNALNKMLLTKEHLIHEMMFTLAAEMKYVGITEDEAIEFFSQCNEYDLRKTLIGYRSAIIERRAKCPFIKRLGYCVGDKCIYYIV